MIGKTLKLLRTIHGYTGKQMSEKLNISPSYLSEIENKKKPKLDLIEKYANIFDLKTSDILFLSENYNRETINKIMNKIIKELKEKL